MCTRYQAKPTKKHLHDVKRIFSYLKRAVNQGLWYPNDSSIALTAFADADHAGCQDTRRSTSGSMQLLGDRLVENEVVELYFVNTEYQLVDIFTKALGRERIEFLITKLGMRSFTLETMKLLVEEAECWVIIVINPLYLTTASFGVDAAIDLKKNMLSV
nr:uncharacterized mitochondrial protein AtMg00810-like [Tanacetum cinerariifolium]